MPRKTRTRLCVKEKVCMIRAIENGEKKSHVAKRLGLSQTAVDSIWKKKDKYLVGELYAKNRKKLRKPTFEDLDRLMQEWVAAQRRVAAPVTEDLLRAEAHRLADLLGVVEFTPSEVWLGELERRYYSISSVGTGVTNANKKSEEASPPAPSLPTHAGDEFDLFFASVSLTAKKLSPAAQERLKCEVMRLVEDEQLAVEARGEKPPPSDDPLRARTPSPAPTDTPVIKEEINVNIKEEIKSNIKEEILEVEMPL